jgi:Uma2 family endonuclease
VSTTTKLTLEQFLALPETEPASEYVCGEVIQKPMPTRLHGIIQGLIAMFVAQFLLKNPLGEAGPEIRCIFGPPEQRRTYVPDFVFITSGRIPEDDASLNGPFHGAPDLAVEILSPTDRPRRVLDKILFYLRHGVRLVWVVDPEDRTVTVYTPGNDGGQPLQGDDLLDGGDVLPGFRVRVEDLFPRRRTS